MRPDPKLTAERLRKLNAALLFEDDTSLAELGGDPSEWTEPCQRILLDAAELLDMSTTGAGGSASYGGSCGYAS